MHEVILIQKVIFSMSLTPICFFYSRVGVFTKPSEHSKEPLLLRVAEVSLNMHELLTDMAKQASKIISCIVDMTNAAYTVPLPSAPDDAEMNVRAFTPPPGTTNESKSPHIKLTMQNSETTGMEPGKKRKVSEAEANDNDIHDGDDVDHAIVSLSVEKCASLVDCLIGELDDRVLSPPTGVKKLKVFDDRAPHAIMN